MSRAEFYNKYFLPGFIFQSVIIAGGYGTGRELVEFFLSFGPIHGLLAMGVAALTWSVVCALTFEYARQLKVYDYRRFFKSLLGRGWILFEFSYFAVVLIVLAVIASSSGNILNMTLGIPYNIGVIGLMAYVCFMVFKGSRMIELIMSFWSFVLYLVFFIFLGTCWYYYGDTISHHFKTLPNEPGWFLSGLKYAGYNLGLIPAVLFATRHIETRKEAVYAGLFAGIIGIIPGMLFFIAMLGPYPEVLAQTVPSTFILQEIGSNTLLLAFNLVLFGTLIETGTGLIHAINERLQIHAQEREILLPTYFRPLLALGCMVIAGLMAQFGLIALISKGYGTLSWVIMLVYLIPISTIGLRQMWRYSEEKVTIS